MWRYWKARALTKPGRGAEGNALLAPLSFEHNFYGQLAMEELGTSHRGRSRVLPARAPTRSRRWSSAPGIQRALKFYQLGLRYEGALEWRWSTRAFDDKELLAAAEVARRAGWYERSIDTAERTQQLHDFTLRFPTPYREVVSNYSRQLDLDEAWVYGLVRQESRFPPMRAPAQERGPHAADADHRPAVASRFGIPGVRPAIHVHTVDTNISLGTYHLRQLLDGLENHPVLASAAYNAGRAGRAIGARTEPLEGAVYAETIPFSETRDYVRKVMSNTMFYARLFGSRSSRSSSVWAQVAPKPLSNE